MENKIKILLEDDNEILGNGYGHPVFRQYLPTKRYVELLNKYDIKGTFYVDMAHYLFLKKNKEYSDFRFQIRSIEETINLLVENEMDVQVHLHSQWVNAKIEKDNIYVSEKWNIGQLTKDEQENLFHSGYSELARIIGVRMKSLDSYKAGSWGIQPFNGLFDIFIKKGIKVVMGPIKGLKVDSLNLDYSLMESNYFPYFADKNDINKIGRKDGVVVLPMTPTYLNWFDLIRYMVELKLNSFLSRDRSIDIGDIPDSIKRMQPLKGKDKLNYGLKPFKTHLKINAQKFWYLRNTFKRSYNFIQKSNTDYKLLIIETHTKDFKNSFDDIDKFLNYVTSNYSDVEFVTANEIVNDIKKNILKPLSLDE